MTIIVIYKVSLHNIEIAGSQTAIAQPWESTLNHNKEQVTMTVNTKNNLIGFIKTLTNQRHEIGLFIDANELSQTSNNSIIKLY